MLSGDIFQRAKRGGEKQITGIVLPHRERKISADSLTEYNSYEMNLNFSLTHLFPLKLEEYFSSAMI